MAKSLIGTWNGFSNIGQQRYRCGYCGADVGAREGYYTNVTGPVLARIYICPMCNRPTFFERVDDGSQVPGVAYGEPVKNVPQTVDALYSEARKCSSAGAHTAAVLACRKLLMHVGVERGAETNKPFIYYVEFLASKGYVPPDGTGWVDHIRNKGNEANH